MVTREAVVEVLAMLVGGAVVVYCVVGVVKAIVDLARR